MKHFTLKKKFCQPLKNRGSVSLASVPFSNGEAPSLNVATAPKSADDSFKVAPSQKKIGGHLAKIWREKLSQEEKKTPKILAQAKKKPKALRKKSLRELRVKSLNSLNIADLPKNDGEICDWLAGELDSLASAVSSKDIKKTKPKTFGAFLRDYGRDFLIKGIKRLNKYQKKREEAIKKGDTGVKPIENPGGYLYRILQNMESERERKR